MSEEAEVIALTTLFQDGPSVRGKIPVALVKALKAKGGDILAIERHTGDGHGGQSPSLSFAPARPRGCTGAGIAI